MTQPDAGKYVPPTQDELDRVAEYWRRVEAMACTHSELGFDKTDDLKCRRCDRPVRILSDIQFQQIREEAIERDRHAAAHD